MKHIYIVFSATPYKVGRLIRRLTGEPYNHVSIALDRGLTQMYSFARRYFRTPLFGGFVKESLSRYRAFNQITQIRVCRLPVTEQQYEALRARLQAMHREKERYLYNHFSVLAAPFRRPVRVRDSYTCVEFAVEVLHSLGLPLDPGKYCSVGDLQNSLSDTVVYTGPAPEADRYDEVFFAPHPVPLFTTLRFLGTLFRRLGK